MRPIRTTLSFLILAGFLACLTAGCGESSLQKDTKLPADPSKQMNPAENMPEFQKK